jgi:hypothetical protein
MISKHTFLFFFSLFFGHLVSGQQITGIASQWSDSFKEWTIYTNVEGEEGHLRLRWNSQGDWTQWEYRVGERTGQIKTRWPERTDQWEVRGENLIVGARTLWRDNLYEWRITKPGGEQYKWQSRYGNVFDEWVVDTEKYGYFEMYATYAGDPRDWMIVDELEGSLPEKMMLVFLTIINTTPKL